MLQITDLKKVKKLKDGSKPARTKFDIAYMLEFYHWMHCFPFTKYLCAYTKEDLQLIYLDCLTQKNLI